MGLKQLAAERLASRYKLRIFPIRTNTKTAAIKDWQKLATTDLDKIGAWWAENPDYNIGVSTEGLCVADLDTKHDGPKHFAEFLETHKLLDEELPPTFTVRTQSGGYHLYYDARDARVANSTSKVTAGVDIRGDGGYVVGPGSTIDGKEYRVDVDKPIMYAPEWFITVAKRRRERSPDAGKRVSEETEEAVAAAEKFIADAPEAIEGNGGDLTTFKVAAQLFNFGVTRETALELMLDYNDTKCIPPWDIDDLEKKIDSAMRNRRDPIGIDNPGVPPLGFEPIEVPEEEWTNPNIDAAAAEDKPRPRIPVLTLKEVIASALDAGPEPLIEGIYSLRQLSAVYGASGAGKTFAVMDGDFCIAAGLPWMGREVKQGAVVWVAAERDDEARHRLFALTKYYGRDDVPFFLIPKTLDLFDPRADLVPLIKAIRELEKTHGVKVEKITLDTLARIMVGGDENVTKEMNILVANLDTLRKAVRAHVSVIHHTNIGEERMRGAYALKGAVDTQLAVRKNRAIFVEKRAGGKDHFELSRFRLLEIELGIHPRTGKMVTSAVVEPIMTRSAAQKDDGDTLLEAIKAEMKKRKMMDDAEFTLELVVQAARNSGISTLSTASTDGSYNSSKEKKAYEKRVRDAFEKTYWHANLKIVNNTKPYRYSFPGSTAVQTPGGTQYSTGPST